MRDRPDAARLLALAREVLVAELAPLLPEARRADAALVARCIGIAERTLDGGDAPFAAAAAALAMRYGEGGPESLLRRLATEIRDGAVDAPGAAQSAVLRLLWTIAVAKLRESNPQFLADAEIDR